MNIFPAIDLIDGKAVRLYKGDYDKMTVYNDDPTAVAKSFENAGAEFLHTVNLQGALHGEKQDSAVNSEVIKKIAETTNLKVQVGGGVRNEEIIKSYLDSGVYRVILGTIAVEAPEFLVDMIKKYGEKIAVGVDIKDGYVATHGWTEKSAVKCDDFVDNLCKIGVKTIICTDISKDGAMMGTNLELYRRLNAKFDIDIIASGGVSSMNDIEKLCGMNMYGAILGKALYTGAIDLETAIKKAGGRE